MDDIINQNKTKKTVEYYNTNSNEYFKNTFAVNMSKLYSFFEYYIEKEASILDFGCGSGRDSKYFINKGYKVTSIDGSNELCNLAGKYIHQEVKCINFLDFDDKNRYDAVWASASLLHLDDNETIIVLNKLIDSIKMAGIIYASWKYGESIYMEDGKLYNDMNETKFTRLLTKVNTSKIFNLKIKQTLISNDEMQRKNKWFNIILEKSLYEY